MFDKEDTSSWHTFEEYGITTYVSSNSKYPQGLALFLDLIDGTDLWGYTVSVFGSTEVMPEVLDTGEGFTSREEALNAAVAAAKEFDNE